MSSYMYKHEFNSVYIKEQGKKLQEKYWVTWKKVTEQVKNYMAPPFS